MSKADPVKTSVKIRSDLWRKAKLAAVDERSDLAAVINDALEAFFKKGSGR